MTAAATMPRQFLSRAEAADYITATYFKITPRTLAAYASDDMGPPYRLFGGRSMYTREDIDAWVKRPEHYGNVPPPPRAAAPALGTGALSAARR